MKDSLLKEAKTDTSFITGDLTMALQSLDVWINKGFKENIKSMYDEWIFEEEHIFTFTEKTDAHWLNSCACGSCKTQYIEEVPVTRW